MLTGRGEAGTGIEYLGSQPGLFGGAASNSTSYRLGGFCQRRNRPASGGAAAATRTVCAPPPSDAPVTADGVGCPSSNDNAIVCCV